MTKILETVNVVPRFPIAVMHWYAQYSNPESARAGTIDYAVSLTPGLTPEVAGVWVDKLVKETQTETQDEITLKVADSAGPD